jgi:hypothetical protein
LAGRGDSRRACRAAAPESQRSNLETAHGIFNHPYAVLGVSGKVRQVCVSLKYPSICSSGLPAPLHRPMGISLAPVNAAVSATCRPAEQLAAEPEGRCGAPEPECWGGVIQGDERRAMKCDQNFKRGRRHMSARIAPSDPGLPAHSAEAASQIHELPHARPAARPAGRTSSATAAAVELPTT